MLRRSPLRCKTCLRARKPLRRYRSRSRRQPRELDPGRLAWIRRQPCCAPTSPRCRRQSEPHHAGRKRGMSLKADDDTCIPLCRQHHRDIEAMAGPWRCMSGAEVRAWQDEQVAVCRAAYEGAREPWDLPADIEPQIQAQQEAP
jgi:hypothetical protein